jgi:hypothetical protein
MNLESFNPLKVGFGSWREYYADSGWFKKSDDEKFPRPFQRR